MRRQHFCIPGAHRLTPLAIPAAHDSRMTHAPMYVFLANNRAKRTCVDNTSVFQGLTESRPWLANNGAKRTCADSTSVFQGLTDSRPWLFQGPTTHAWFMLRTRWQIFERIVKYSIGLSDMQSHWEVFKRMGKYAIAFANIQTHSQTFNHIGKYYIRCQIFHVIGKASSALTYI